MIISLNPTADSRVVSLLQLPGSRVLRWQCLSSLYLLVWFPFPTEILINDRMYKVTVNTVNGLGLFVKCCVGGRCRSLQLVLLLLQRIKCLRTAETFWFRTTVSRITWNFVSRIVEYRELHFSVISSWLDCYQALPGVRGRTIRWWWSDFRLNKSKYASGPGGKTDQST